MLGMMLDGIQSPAIRYQEWRRKKMNDGKDRMKIVDVEKTKDELIEMMKEAHREFGTHIHNVKEQYKGVKQMKEKLPKDHVLVQMDFSENYC